MGSIGVTGALEPSVAFLLEGSVHAKARKFQPYVLIEELQLLSDK